MMVSPPLTWTKADIDEFMRLATLAIDLTAKDVAGRKA
jgi:hypothetical protein